MDDFIIMIPDRVDRVDNLPMLFKDAAEQDLFMAELSEEAKHYVAEHANEFHCKEELEIVAVKFGKKDPSF